MSTDSDSNGRGETVDLQDVLDEGGIADAFDALRSQGLVRFLGFTGLGDTAALHQLIESGRFDLLQVYYNLLNPSARVAMAAGFAGYDFRRLINLADRNNMGVVVIRVLAGGALGRAIAHTGYAVPSVGGPIVPGGGYDDDEVKAGSWNSC